MEDLSGQLLLATPSLLDPNFHRAVILLLDHGDHGAMGVMLNRPLEVRVDAVLPTWQPYVTEPAVLFQGGPVGLDSALGLVAMPGDLPEPAGIRRLDGSLALVDLDTEPATVVPHLSGIRVFAGYAGWGADQLEGEIREGSWYVVPSEPRDAFSPDPTLLWRQVLRRQPGDLSYVASFPEDPSLN
jgi:putative transcriptional regulator